MFEYALDSLGNLGLALMIVQKIVSSELRIAPTISYFEMK